MKKFFRSKLATIVWDSANNCILADFKMGYFTTSDKRKIKILKELGYPEVEIESEAPPEGLSVEEKIVFENDTPVIKLESNAENYKLNSEKIKKPELKKKEATPRRKIRKPKIKF